MQIKGTPTFFVATHTVESNPKESVSTRTDAATPEAAAHPPSKPMPSSFGRSTGYLLRQKLAAGSGVKSRMESKAGTPAGTGAAHLEDGSTQAFSALALTPRTAITNLFLGTPDEKSEAEKYLADFADAIIGPNRLTVAAEAALWGDRLRRPGF